MERKNIFNGFRSQSLSSLTKIIVIIIIIVVAKQIQEDERLKMLTMMVRSAIVTWLQSLPLLICQSAGGEIEREQALLQRLCHKLEYLYSVLPSL